MKFPLAGERFGTAQIHVRAVHAAGRYFELVIGINPHPKNPWPQLKSNRRGDRKAVRISTCTAIIRAIYCIDSRNTWIRDIASEVSSRVAALLIIDGVRLEINDGKTVWGSNRLIRKWLQGSGIYDVSGQVTLCARRRITEGIHEGAFGTGIVRSLRRLNHKGRIRRAAHTVACGN